jgi:Cu+-exporting ATPase
MSVVEAKKGLVKDPVCGMSVDPATAKATAEYEGRAYYFCCSGCRDAFVADPAHFVAAGSRDSATTASGHVAQRRHSGDHGNSDSVSASAAKDAVCGMSVDPATGKHRAEHAGVTFYFCSARCREKFVAEPAKYLAPEPVEPSKAAEAAPGVIYTCPMHPQTRKVGPGACPICGMALEPEVATAETGPSPELVDMTRRFWGGLAFAVPVVALEMGEHLPGVHALIGQQASSWIQFALATPVVLWKVGRSSNAVLRRSGRATSICSP